MMNVKNIHLYPENSIVIKYENVFDCPLANTLRKFAGSEQANREISSELNGGPILTLKKRFFITGPYCTQLFRHSHLNYLQIIKVVFHAILRLIRT